jgi:predicted aspartyl protease
MMCRAIFSIVSALAATGALGAVPLSYAPSGHPTVPTYIEGKGPYPFVIDTGAEGAALYRSFARQRGFEPLEGKFERLQGQTGDASLPLITLGSMSVDGRTVGQIEAVVLPDRADGMALHGIVGLDLLSAYAVEFDMGRGQVALHDPDELVAGGVLTGMRATPAVRLPGGLLGFAVTINGAKGVAVLDTGARDSRINGRFAHAARLNFDPAEPASGGVIHGATNAPIRTRSATVSSIEFGSIRHSDAVVRVVDLPVFEALGIARQPAMILGMDLLKSVHLVADFSNGTVWLRSVQDE